MGGYIHIFIFIFIFIFGFLVSRGGNGPCHLDLNEKQESEYCGY